jgi:hypothetical protein
MLPVLCMSDREVYLDLEFLTENHSSDFSRIRDHQEASEFRIAQMDLKLSSWKNDLPSEIDISKSSPCVPQPHQLMLHMTYHWLTILLHRPFYRRRKTCDDLENYTDHIKPCNKSAAEIMELAGIWRRHFSLRYVPITMIQVISAAATIFVVAAVQAVSGPRIAHNALESAEKYAGLAIQYLREVGESFASATNVADILQHLLQGQVQTRKARRSPGSSPSGGGYSPPMGPPRFPNPSPMNPFGWNGDPNTISTSPWMELIGTPLNSMYPNAQYPMNYSSAQYSTLAGALETPLNYHQPFGDGLGESLYFQHAVTPPGMGMESAVRSDPVVTRDAMTMPSLRSSPEAPYAYQMDVPAIHAPRH